MTIRDLLVKRRYWPDLNGPKRNVTTGWKFIIYPNSLPKKQWIEIRHRVDMWHQYEISVWVYVPKKVKNPMDFIYLDDVTLKPCIEEPKLIDRGWHDHTRFTH